MLAEINLSPRWTHRAIIRSNENIFENTLLTNISNESIMISNERKKNRGDTHDTIEN